MTFVYAYLWFGVVFAAVLLVVGLVDDLRGHIDHKFGPNYSSTLFWGLAVIQLVPIVNLLAVWMWLVIFHNAWIQRIKRSK